MSGMPPPYPPPYSREDWKNQRRVLRDQTKAQRDLAREQQRVAARMARGSSILGPLLVIAIGVAFFLLSVGRLSYDRVGAWYGQWWPLLLVGCGVVLLVEWAFARRRSEDGARYTGNRVGGGVTLLLILLCLPGIALNVTHGDTHWIGRGFSFNGDNMDEFLGDRHESDEAFDRGLPAGTALVVSNPHGDVTITGSSDDGTIHVAAHKTIYSRTDSDASGKADRLTPVMTIAGGVATVSVASMDGGRTDLTISLPTTTATTVTADHGTIHVGSLKAGVTVTANHGDIELNAIGGTVTSRMNSRGSSFSARGVRGGLTLDGDCRDVDIAEVTGAVSLHGDFFGKTHLEHVGGTVRFHTSRTDFQVGRLDGGVDITRGQLSADQIVGPVAMTARSYNVTLDRVAGDVSVTTSDGSVDVTGAPPLGNITVQNRNGSVNVTVPEHVGFTVQAETRNGDVETDLPLTRNEDGHSHRLSGTVGGGGPLIRIDTTQNDISLKTGVIAPLPPPAPPAPPITFTAPARGAR